MSPIPKPERKPTPVEKAVQEILRQVQKGMLEPPTLVVHPSDAKDIQRLLEEAKRAPLQVGAKPVEVREGPLMKAYREGMMTTGISWDEQHRMNQTQLERDLEDSLWALVEGIVPATPEAVREHSPHQQGSETRIKRVHDNAVDILCLCKQVLRFHRCVHRQGAARCAEEVPHVEAGHALCVFHRASNDEWLPGSRFYRCDYLELDGGRCHRVATMVSADGRHWCSEEGHSA